MDGTNVGNFHPPEREFDVDYDFTAHAEFAATLVSGIVTGTGLGSLDGTTQTHIGAASLDRVQDADWTYGFSVDTANSNACAAGTFSGSANQFAFDGTFADGIATWDISRAGQFVRTVTEDYSCGQGGTGGP